MPQTWFLSQSVAEKRLQENDPTSHWIHVERSHDEFMVSICGFTANLMQHVCKLWS